MFKNEGYHVSGAIKEIDGDFPVLPNKIRNRSDIAVGRGCWFQDPLTAQRS